MKEIFASNWGDYLITSFYINILKYDYILIWYIVNSLVYSKYSNMKKSLYILFFVLNIFILAWCKESNQTSNQVITWSTVFKEIKVTDPEVLQELQFMRDENMITSASYEEFIRMDMPIKWWESLESQYYSSCPEPECDWLFSRKMIRNLMKDKGIQ